MRARPLAVLVAALAAAVLLAALGWWVIARTSPQTPDEGGWRAGPGERLVTDVYTTGYTWFDNTPPGSPRISHPQVHRTAGGAGSYDDPITAAVGHSLASGRDVLDLPPGTRLYVPHVRRYFVVEDTCGDGAAPQHRGCHDLADAPDGARLWIDLYIGGDVSADRRAVQGCAGRITDGDSLLHPVIVGARRGYPVAGPALFHEGECTDLFPSHPLPTPSPAASATATE